MGQIKLREADIQHVGPGHWVAYSSRDRDKWYHLRRVGKTWTCECPGYLNHGHCYHRDTLKRRLMEAPPKKMATMNLIADSAYAGRRG